MNNIFLYQYILLLEGLSISRFQTNRNFSLTIHSTYSRKGISVFSFYRKLLRILPLLIISSIKQKLMITLNDDLKPISCAILRLITGTCIIIFMGLFSGVYRGAI